MRTKRTYTLFPRTFINTGTRIWYYRYYKEDKRVTKSTGCASKEQAIRYVEENLHSTSISPAKPEIQYCYAPQAGYWLKLNTMTFKEYATSWWQWDTCEYVLAKRAAGSEEKPGIKESYVHSNKLWNDNYLIPYFGECLLTEITTELVNKFLIYLSKDCKLSNKTINNIRSTLSVMLDVACDKKLILSNPVSGTFQRTVCKKKTELLTDDECKRLFDSKEIHRIWKGEYHYYTFSYIAGLTGMRAGELLALTLDDITPTTIHVSKSYSGKYGLSTTKTSEERTIPITIEMYNMLVAVYKMHPKKSRYIFSISGEAPMGEGNSRLALYKAMEHIGISEAERKRRNITFHSWRHKFTTECVKADMSPEKIRALTGHASSEMLATYTDLSAADLSKQINNIQRSKQKLFRS